MKYKLNGPLIAAVLIAALAAVGITICLWILSIISWFLVYIALFIISVPVVHWLMGIYHRTKCYTLEELWYEVISTLEDEEDSESSSLDD